jgi:NitT/TauT family transport system substrate-binding protein
VTPIRLRVFEPFRSIFYAPNFVAIHGGHFASEGFEITLVTASKALGTVDALRDGTADLALSGLMRSFELVDRGGPPLVHFAAVNDRNGFFLLSREPRPRFAWSDLVGRTVISFSGAPTPWLCMQAVLRRHAVDPARVTFVRDLGTGEAIDAFRARKADFLEHGPPMIDDLVAEGTGHLVASMGEATGPVPFTSFMTTPEKLARERAMLVRFVRGGVSRDRPEDPGARGRAVSPAGHLEPRPGADAHGIRGAAGDPAGRRVHHAPPSLRRPRGH